MNTTTTTTTSELQFRKQFWFESRGFDCRGVWPERRRVHTLPRRAGKFDEIFDVVGAIKITAACATGKMMAAGAPGSLYSPNRKVRYCWYCFEFVPFAHHPNPMLLLVAPSLRVLPFSRRSNTYRSRQETNGKNDPAGHQHKERTDRRLEAPDAGLRGNSARSAAFGLRRQPGSGRPHGFKKQHQGKMHRVTWSGACWVEPLLPFGSSMAFPTRPG